MPPTSDAQETTEGEYQKKYNLMLEQINICSRALDEVMAAETMGLALARISGDEIAYRVALERHRLAEAVTVVLGVIMENRSHKELEEEIRQKS